MQSVADKPKKAIELADEPREISPAHRLQQRAEAGDVERDLTHQERANVANRLFRSGGWREAWTWFEGQYGERFDPEITYKQFQSLVDSYPDLNDIVVPSGPDNS
jgi:hypothetical protein